MHRRDFVKKTALSLGSLTLFRCADVEDLTETSSRIKVGTGPDSWGVWFAEDAKQIPWNRYLDEVVEAGYEWTELGPYGYMPVDLSNLRTELESRHLKLAGGFVIGHLEDNSRYSELEKEALLTGRLVAELGAKFLVLIDHTYTDLSGEQILPRQLKEDDWQRLIENTQKLSNVVANRLGLQVVFHPHADSHVEYPDQVERFLDETDSNVQLCLDTGHYAYRGGDSVDLVRRRHDRISYLHLKTVDATIRSVVEKEKVPFVKAVAMDMFCELSEGVIDFEALRDILREVNYDGWAIVEQDMYPAPFDKPLPIAKRTRQYLLDIDFG